MSAAAEPIPVVMVVDCSIASVADRPRRVFDFGPLKARVPRARQIAHMHAESDADYDRQLDRLGNQQVRRWRLFVAGLWGIFSELPTLRRARVVFCFSPHQFWWLAMFWRLGLFPVRGKTICGIFSRSQPFLRKKELLKRLPPEFLPYFMVPRQIEDLVKEGCPRERLHALSWRIDTHWYVPATEKTDDPPGAGYVLCAGMAYRDEALVARLVGRLGRKLIRATRTEHLRAFYRENLPAEVHDDPAMFEFLILRDHRAYLRLLQQAELMILPIHANDEPAGLTTALEAFACEVPLVANSSYGVTELLAEGYGLAPVPRNDPAPWLEAIAAALRGETITPEALRRGRRLVQARYHAGDDIEDWRDLAAVRREVDAAAQENAPSS